MNEPSTFQAALANEAATANLMADLALLLSAGDVITLTGDLGAGKTAAARALIRYLAQVDDPRCPALLSRWRKPTTCRPFRCCTPISIASTTRTSWKKSDCRRCRRARWR